MNPELRMSRRNFVKLLAGSVILGPPSTDFAFWLPEIQRAFTEVSIREHTLTDPRIQHPYCLVHTSDAHFTATTTYQAFIDAKAARNIVSRVNNRLGEILQARPYTTILSINTGDFVIQSEDLDTLESLKQGLTSLSEITAHEHMCVLGNHDQSFGHVKEITELISSAGFSILDADNQASSVSFHNRDIEIFGTPDYTTNQSIYENVSNKFQLQQFFYGTTPKIWLTHNAQMIDTLGFYDLAKDNVLLSLHGHTHGGQFSDGGLFRPYIRDAALQHIGYTSSLIDGIYHDEGTSYWINVNTGLGSITGDLVHIRGIMPRVDLIHILPGEKSSYHWDGQHFYTYR